MMCMCRKAVEPLGEAWPEFKIWNELGKRMGYEDWFRWETLEDFHREITEPIDIDYDELKEINSDIKILLSSGYSIDGQASEILRRGCNGFIQKPFSIKELSGKLREILEKKL